MVFVCQHHSYRTFQGLTCLIQVSTRSEDFVIDSLTLREHIHLLNDSFTDPKILKVTRLLLLLLLQLLLLLLLQLLQLLLLLQLLQLLLLLLSLIHI